MLNVRKGEILLVNKPLDWTSFDVVGKIRSIFHVRKVGHAGTLDPKATGLLIICTGPKTKEINRFADLEKEYKGVMELGARTPSGDTETAVIERKSLSNITEERIRAVCSEFVGAIEQIPPMHSAVKVNGKPLYKIARKGETIERKPRKVYIAQFAVTKVELPFVHFHVVCSKGTYIRSLVNDVGERLQCGAYLKSLTRTRIGDFTIDKAFSISDLEQLAKSP